MKLPLLNIFRTSKVFAVVLGLHLFVLSLLLFHPGCQKNTPPPATPAESAPMGQVSALDNATLTEPTHPADASNPALNDAAAASTSTVSSAVVTNEAPPAPVPSQTTYTVEKGDSLWSIARKNGVSVSALLETNGLNRSSVLKPGQSLKIPAATTAPVAGSASAASSTEETIVPAKEGSYTVKAGDSLAKIAKANHVSVRALKTANHLHSDTVHVGETLKIPHGGKHAKKEAAEPSESARESTASAAATGDTGTTTYTVEKGDSPATIAKKFGMKTSELLSLNDITDPHKLKVGQELKVKGTASTETATSPVSASDKGDKKPMSVEALEAATSSTSDASAPVVEVKPAATLSK
jgi:LysM repeat protein